MTGVGDPRVVPTGVMGALVGTGAFVCELGMLAALGLAGWSVAAPAGVAWGVLLAVALPLLAAAVWGRWMAPRAPRRLTDPSRLGVELVLFAAAGTGLVLAGHVGWAVALVLLWAVTAPFGRRVTPA